MHEFHDFLVLHLSRRDMHVLSDEYANIGAMHPGHVIDSLRYELHARGSLSLAYHRDMLEINYVDYVQQYALMIEEYVQEDLEQ